MDQNHNSKSNLSKYHTISLTSPSFSEKDGKFIFPPHLTCDGANSNAPLPRLLWSLVPEATSYAIICVDTHPIAHRWIHLYIPLIQSKKGSSVNEIERMIVGKNTFGNYGYQGPCPPVGSGEHRYLFYLFALKGGELPASEREECRDIPDFINRCSQLGIEIIAYGKLAAFYEKK